MKLQNSLKKIESKLPSPDNWKVWISIAFICKLILFIFCISKDGINPVEGFWGHFGGDTESYLDPIENLINKGEYQPDYRMPGYGVFYLPLYWLFSKAIALNILIILQLFFSIISTYFLAKLALKIFKSLSVFYLTFLLYTINTHVDLYLDILLTESLATSFLIIAFYLFLNFTETKNYLHLFISGLALTEVIFLRPIFSPLLFLFLLVLIVHLFRDKLRNKLMITLLFLSSFIIIDSTWIIRNYIVHKKVAPLTTSVYYPSIENGIILPIANFIQSFGGNSIWWETGAEIRWFGFGDNVEFGKGVDRNTKLPTDIYTSQFNLDSLISIRTKVISVLKDTTLTIEQNKTLTQEIRTSFNNFTQSIKSEKPYLYYIKSPLLITKNFFIHSGTQNLFFKSSAELNKFEYLVKVFYSLLYIITLFIGFVGVFLLIKKSFKINNITILTGIIVYSALIHPIFLRAAEPRYFVPTWPFLIICFSYAIVWIYNSIFIAKQKNVK
ncbi:MAG: hypothetical protein V4667_13110 [Bacteroidota bacterium]